MKIGILVTSIASYGQKGYYNLQEVGLGRELSGFFDEVVIYKLVNRQQEKRTELIDKNTGLIMHFIPSRSIGVNGIMNTELLDKSMDVLLYFTDIQIVVPKVYSWSRQNQVLFLPYIGITFSTSNNKIKQGIMNLLAGRNLAVYKQCHCLAKTLAVRDILKLRGVMDVEIAPVGLDSALLKKNFELVSRGDLKRKWDIESSDQVLLFVGRLVPEKNPLEAIKLIEILNKDTRGYSLIMVGRGPLQSEVEDAIRTSKEYNKIKYIPQIPNSEIWELYHLSDYFINLFYKEIFGMAILEAMQYKCLVMAFSAPGPDYIIEDGENGFIRNSVQEMADLIETERDYQGIMDEAKKRVEEKFTWRYTAKLIYDYLQQNHRNA